VTPSKDQPLSSTHKYVKKSSSAQISDETPISDEDMAKKIIGSFHKYYRKGEIVEEDDETLEGNEESKGSPSKKRFILDH
jgi:hypothetical protein